MGKEKNREKSLAALTKIPALLEHSGLSDSLVQEAIEQNPWFSHYYIDERLKNIQSWLIKSKLYSWVEAYPLNSEPVKNVGLITAGNLPLVGFHDVMAILLSGHRVQIKCSRRDFVLMKHMIELLVQAEPRLSAQIQFVTQFSTIDYLVASGGDQAAKDLNRLYQGIPQTLRKHRYSVAILEENTEIDELNKLLTDIFLFNGQGCRSVSNIILPPCQISPLINVIKSYPKEKLTSPYNNKVDWERAKNTTLAMPFLEGDHVLLLPSSGLGSTEIGTIRIIPMRRSTQRKKMVQKNIHLLQCVVNKGTEFGESQYPAITTFEDNVDLLKILTLL